MDFHPFFSKKLKKTHPIRQKLGALPTLTFLKFYFWRWVGRWGQDGFFFLFFFSAKINSNYRLWGARFKTKQTQTNKQTKNSTKYLCNLKKVQSLLIIQNMVLIQCIYNAIHDLAAILLFTTILKWYVIFDILMDRIYETITHEWLLFWKTTNLHSNICQNLLFWQPFCFSLIS